jgi:hypothetical protein
LDLGRQIKDDDGHDFSYQCYVTGDYLNYSVDTERISFNFPTGEAEEDEQVVNDNEEVSLKNIRNGLILKL